MRIAVVAPSSRLGEEAAGRVTDLAARLHPGLEIHFHPQCFLSHNHFAGTDAERVEALVESANDPAFDAIWFARGGYGACRVAEAALARLGPAARDKAWLGYSDAGYLLAGLMKAGFPDLAHGPMPRDIMREGGEAAVARALAWLVRRDADALEPGLALGDSHAAFNMTVFSLLLGTKLEPDLTGQVLLLEEVSEHMYRVDRSLFHIVRPGIGAADRGHQARPGQRGSAQRSRFRRRRGEIGPLLVRRGRHRLSRPRRYRSRFGEQSRSLFPVLIG